MEILVDFIILIGVLVIIFAFYDYVNKQKEQPRYSTRDRLLMFCQNNSTMLWRAYNNKFDGIEDKTKDYYFYIKLIDNEYSNCPIFRWENRDTYPENENYAYIKIPQGYTWKSFSKYIFDMYLEEVNGK